MTLHDLIRRQFGLPLTGIDGLTATKGETVYRAGRVRGVTASMRQAAVGAVGIGSNAEGTAIDQATAGWELAAAVSGSHGETYRTTVLLSRDDRSLKANSDCTCPVR